MCGQFSIRVAKIMRSLAPECTGWGPSGVEMDWGLASPGTWQARIENLRDIFFCPTCYLLAQKFINNYGMNRVVHLQMLRMA